MPVKAGADGNSLNDADHSATRQRTANSWQSDYFLASHLKPWSWHPQQGSTGGRYLKKMGLMGCRRHFKFWRGNEMVRPTRDGRSTRKEQTSHSPGRRAEASRSQVRALGAAGRNWGAGRGQIPTQDLAQNIKVKGQTGSARGPEGQPQSLRLRRQTPTQDRGNRFGQGLRERPHLRMRPLLSAAASPPPNHSSPHNTALRGSRTQSRRPRPAGWEHRLAPRRGYPLAW